MVKSVERPKKGDSKISFIRRNSLVLSIDKNEKIIKFNDKCEHVFGYTKEEVIDKKFLDFLIPSRYTAQWKSVLGSLRKEKLIEDFKLPILTHKGYEIMISWSSFPIKIAENVVGDIDFVGTLIDSWIDSEVPLVRSSDDEVKSKVNVDFGDGNKTILRLLKANEGLEKKNQKLEKSLSNIKSRRGKKQGHTSYSGKLVYSLADIVGGKKRRQEFERMMNELDDREKKLDKLGSQFLKDKKKANELRNEFCEWREKLELLESEIENRNNDLEDRARLLDSTIALGKNIGMVSAGFEGEMDVQMDDSCDVLDGIPDCAVVIQRGILKQVTDSFADLIGYNVNEIVEKSFFDFIAPEGLSGMEKYYLDRLKGEKITDYETVFLASDDQTVPMRVSIKSTVFNGEKAEIAVFTKPGDVQEGAEGVSEMCSQPETVVGSEVEEPSKEEMSAEPGQPTEELVEEKPAEPEQPSVEEVSEETTELEPSAAEPVAETSKEEAKSEDAISDMVKKAQAKKEK